MSTYLKLAMWKPLEKWNLPSKNDFAFHVMILLMCPKWFAAVALNPEMQTMGWLAGMKFLITIL